VPGRLGLIAGGGDLPLQIARHCVETGRPLFANPNGDAWVVLLEKAMAKFNATA
jgi:DUF1009 family protein